MLTLEERTYPIGKLNRNQLWTDETRLLAIQEVQSLGDRLNELFKSISKEQYNHLYRAESWNIQEIIHHLADAHLTMLFRLKLTLSDDHPTVVPFPENIWTKQADVQDLDPSYSILILQGVQKRAAYLFSTLNASERNRTFYNPASDQNFSCEALFKKLHWHGEHHLAQIKIAAKHPA